MNTIEDLINHGIERYTAERMLEDYKKRIGTMNGVYPILGRIPTLLSEVKVGDECRFLLSKFTSDS